MNGNARAVEIVKGLYTLIINSDGSINTKSTGVTPNENVLQGTLILDGTTQQLAADVSIEKVTVQAAPGNGANMFIGNATLDGTNGGVELSPGSSKDFTVSNINLLYVKGTNTDRVTYIGEV